MVLLSSSTAVVAVRGEAVNRLRSDRLLPFEGHGIHDLFVIAININGSQLTPPFTAVAELFRAALSL